MDKQLFSYFIDTISALTIRLHSGSKLREDELFTKSSSAGRSTASSYKEENMVGRNTAIRNLSEVTQTKKMIREDPSSFFSNSKLKIALILLCISLAVITFFSFFLIWQVSNVEHFLFEIFGVVLSSIIAFFCLNRAVILKHKISLFIGLGFVASSIIDSLHAIVSLNFLGDNLFLNYFIPQTWVAGRIIDSSMMIVAFGLYAKFLLPAKKFDKNKVTKKTFTMIGIIIILSIGSIFISLVFPIPLLLLEDFVVHRPLDVLGAGLFLAAAVMFVKMRGNLVQDHFFKGLFAYLIINFFAEIIISFSSANFNAQFNISHILKNVGYFVVILFLVKSIILQYQTKHNLVERLQTTYYQLEQSEQKFRELYETSPDLYRSINTDGKIIECNQRYAQRLQYKKEEIIGASIFDHVSEDTIDQLKESFERWKQRGISNNHEIQMKRKDGSTFPALVSATSIYDENGNLIASNTTIKDLTEINKAKEQIQEEKLKRLTAIGELSARIAHDLRNPMSVIKNTTELIELELDAKHDESLSKKFQRINRAITRINHQVENVLDFVRDKPLEFENTSVSSILNYVIDKINVPSDVTINLPKNDVKIYCDFEKLEIVFINLITNAIQAMSNTGEINIRFTDEESQVIIEIEDFGPGIPEKSLSKIFDPLFTTRQVGTGLGLPSCKNIVEKHGGTIEVKTRIDEGTTFVIKLPKKLNLVAVDAK
ncbi:MAG: PAS domain S-box protein [Thaumarchaeota archaeon]|nr:PAS domain S-box protein [Nitrososphaerota archaeon]